MKRKILKGALILTCQFVLMTGVSFASDANEEYFNFKTFEKVSSEIEGEIEKEYLDSIEKEYKEAYNLEKEMKYFKADEEWEDLWSVVRRADDKLVDYDYESEELVEEFQEYIEDMERDYRYGLPSFKEAYELELKDFVNSMDVDKRKKFKELLKDRYKEMEVEYKKYIDQSKLKNGKNKDKELELLSNFNRARREVESLIKVIDQPHNLIITKNGAYDITSVWLNPEEFYKFLKEEKVIKTIGKKNIGKLRNLSKEAREAKNDGEADEFLDEIEEMLYDFFSPKDKDYEGKNNRNIKKINRLYDEITD